MTNNIAIIATEIETLSADLLKVNAAVEAIGADILGKAALNKANDLSKALADAKDRLDTALADEETEARNKRLGQFSSIRVTATAPATAPNLISTAFHIEYDRLAYDMDLKQSVPEKHKCNGFAALDDTAFEYLVTVKPEAIPAAIMALAPGNPHAAFDAYFIGLRRGMFRTDVAATAI